MSGRAAVRAAIASYLQGANISLLRTVFPYPPRITSEAEFASSALPGTGSGAVIWIHFQGQSERRIALGGVTSGQKFRVLETTLICLLKSKKPTAEAAGQDNDTFLDSLVTAIEANRTAAAPSVVFQWGEGDIANGVDIQIRSNLPRSTRQQTFQVFSVCSVAVTQMLST